MKRVSKFSFRLVLYKTKARNWTGMHKVSSKTSFRVISWSRADGTVDLHRCPCTSAFCSQSRTPARPCWGGLVDRLFFFFCKSEMRRNFSMEILHMDQKRQEPGSHAQHSEHAEHSPSPSDRSLSLNRWERGSCTHTYQHILQWHLSGCLMSLWISWTPSCD